LKANKEKILSELIDTKIEESEGKEVQIISKFWMRIIAYLIDYSILAILGFLILLLIKPFVFKIGELGRIIGFTIFIIYHGGMNSKLFNGQTLGKKIIKIKVTKMNGKSLTLFKSIIRSSILGMPIFLNKVNIPSSSDSILMKVTLSLITFIIFFGFISTAYLYIFNKRTRQTLHDFAFNSVVVLDNSSPRNNDFEKVRKIHFVLVGLFACIFGIISFFFVMNSVGGTTSKFVDAQNIRAEIQSLPSVRNVSINENTMTMRTGGSSTTTLNLNITIFLNDEMEEKKISTEDIKSVLRMHEVYVRNFDYLNVQYVVSANIGLASFNNKFNERIEINSIF